MPFGGMCHRTFENASRGLRGPRVTNAFRRDVSSDSSSTRTIRPSWTCHQCLSAGCVIGLRRGMAPGCRVHGHQCLSAGCVIGRSTRRLNGTWRSRVTNAFRRDVSSDNGIVLAIPALACVTNAFRRDVSSDAADLSAPRRAHVSPMPFGGMCHRTPSEAEWQVMFPCHQCLSAGCVIGPTSRGKSRGLGPVTNAFRRDVSSDRRPHRGAAGGAGVTNAFRRDVSSDTVIAAFKGLIFRSPMPFGGMCHRTHVQRNHSRRRSESPMPFGGMCHRTVLV